MIDPAERPTYGSLSEPPVAPATRRRPVLSWLITAAAVAFALGLLANPWFEQAIRSHIPGLRGTMADDAATVAALRARLAALEASPRLPTHALPPTGNAAQVTDKLEDVEDAQASVEQRLSGLEREVGELRARTESSLATVEQGAERAQTVLLVTALRRTLDRGRRLDVFEPALRARFGQAYPNETAALLALGRAPVTPDQLAQMLERLSPSVESAAVDGSDWWAQLKAGLAGVVDIRRTGEVSATPDARLRLAVRQLRAGDVESAVLTVGTLPPPARRAAAGWIAAAHRYLAGTQALAALEVAALAPPPPVTTTFAPTTNL